MKFWMKEKILIYSALLNSNLKTPVNSFTLKQLTQYGPKVPGLNFLPLSYQRHLPGCD
jgi:hypothetical protein